MRIITQKQTATMIAGVGFSLLLHFSAVAQQTNPDNPAETQHTRQTERKASLPDENFWQQATESNQAEIAMSRMALEKAASPEVKAYASQMLNAHTQALEELKNLRMESRQAGISSRNNNAGKPAGSGQTSSTGNRNNNRNSSTASGNTGSSVDHRTDTTGSESGLGVNASPAVGSRMGQTDNAGDLSPGMSAKAYAGYGNLSEEHQVAINQMKGLAGNEFDKYFIAAQLKLHREALALLEPGAKSDQPGPIRQFSQRMLPEIRQHLQKATQLQATLPN